MAQREIPLTSGASRAVFDPDDGLRLSSLVLGGRELIAADAGRGVFWWGAFVMAPWTSNLDEGRFAFLGEDYRLPIDQDGDAIHGVARKASWQWDGQAATASLGFGWPFGGRITVEPTLSDTALEITMTLTAGEEAMPAAIGWHPWFVRSLDSVTGQVVIPTDALIQHRDDSGVPTGLWQKVEKSPLNDGLRSSGPIDVRWGDIGRVRVVSDGGYWIVFDDNDHGICVEPMTGPAGAMDRLLAPGESLSLSFRIEWMGR